MKKLPAFQFLHDYKNDIVSHHQKAGEEEADDGAGLRARHDEGGHGGPLTLRGPPGQHAGDAGEGGRLEEPHHDPDNDEIVGVAGVSAQLGSAGYEKTEESHPSHGHSHHPLPPEDLRQSAARELEDHVAGEEEARHVVTDDAVPHKGSVLSGMNLNLCQNIQVGIN